MWICLRYEVCTWGYKRQVREDDVMLPWRVAGVRSDMFSLQMFMHRCCTAMEVSSGCTAKHVALFPVLFDVNRSQTLEVLLRVAELDGLSAAILLSICDRSERYCTYASMTIFVVD